jgi:hypothetical protein
MSHLSHARKAIISRMIHLALSVEAFVQLSVKFLAVITSLNLRTVQSDKSLSLPDS